MYWNEELYLISSEITIDEIGNEVETLTERLIFANEFGVSSSEYYNAISTGLRPSKRFEVFRVDYQDEKKLKCDGVIYSIIRTEAKGDIVRITCERVAADG